MEDKAGVPVEPGVNVLVGGVVVEDDMDDLAGRDVGFDRIEKANELLMAMALHAAADDPAFQDVERGKQGRGAMALVIVRHCRATALLHRQTGNTIARTHLDCDPLAHAQPPSPSRAYTMRTLFSDFIHYRGFDWPCLGPFDQISGWVVSGATGGHTAGRALIAGSHQ